MARLKLLRSVADEDDLDVLVARELLGVSDRPWLTLGSAALVLVLDLHMGLGGTTSPSNSENSTWRCGGGGGELRRRRKRIIAKDAGEKDKLKKQGTVWRHGVESFSSLQGIQISIPRAVLPFSF